MVKLGTNLPEHLLGKDQGALTAFLQGLEELGYSYLTIGDHVLGADTSVRPDWRPHLGKEPPYDYHMVWHEPLVVFGYLAALTTSLDLCTGILISPQRQTTLLAKQMAEVDVLTGGRTRFVIAAGYNDVEYEALGVEFSKRGKILDEQFALMRELWTHEVVTFEGDHHKVTAAGINPMPIQRPIPLWLGGQTRPALRRTGRLADGWFPYYPWFHEDQLYADLEVIHESAREAGREPAKLGLEGAIYFADHRFEMPEGGRPPPTGFDECIEYAMWWKRFGATHFWVTAPWAGLSSEETGRHESGRSWPEVDARLAAYADFKGALGPDF
jgi:probable F420-dependent oxidoreductase